MSTKNVVIYDGRISKEVLNIDKLTGEELLLLHDAVITGINTKARAVNLTDRQGEMVYTLDNIYRDGGHDADFDDHIELYTSKLTLLDEDAVKEQYVQAVGDE